MGDQEKEENQNFGNMRFALERNPYNLVRSLVRTREGSRPKQYLSVVAVL